MKRVLALLVLLALGSGCRSPEPAAPLDPDTVPDAYKRPSAALVWPMATRSFLVDAAGDLYNGAWAVRFPAAEDGQAIPPPRVIAYEERWRPVVQWRRHGEKTRWDFEAVALPVPVPAFARARAGFDEWREAKLQAVERRAEEARPATTDGDRLDELVVRASRRFEPRIDERVGLLVSLEIRVTNTSFDPVEVELAPDLVASSAARAFFDPSARVGAALPCGWTDEGDTAIAWHDAVIDTNGGTGAPRVRVRLDPRETRRERFVLSAYPLETRALERWAAIAHPARVAEARRWWTHEVDRGMKLELGDRELEDAVRAARVVLLACRERRSGLEVPLGGPFHYRDVWLRDGARAAQALALHGYTREARRLAASFEAWQWPHGPFVSQGAQLDGTGQAMWALGETMLRPAPGPEIRRVAAAAERAWRWCERQRLRRRKENKPFTAMLPFADPRDNELVRGQLVGNDAWALAGYRATARLLRAAGRPADAVEVERSRERYARDFERALDATRSKDLPPAWSKGGIDWGNLAVAWPCGALSADHPRVTRLARRYWAAAGGPGLGFYRKRSARHGYVAADLGTAALLAGRRAEADSVLAALLLWRTASGGAGELFGKDGDYGTNLPPHATSAAALLALTRNALVFDDRDTLELTLGARDSWWRRARVSGAPTRWGVVALEFARDAKQARWHWTPVPVWTALTLPPETRLDGPPPAPLRMAMRPDQVLAPPGTGEVRVRIRELADPAFTASR